jgi:hypothetical protein
MDHGDTLDIDAGLAAGDRIIDHPADSLAEGDAVHVVAAAAATGAPHARG